MTTSLCLEMIFTGQPFLERIALASAAGYRAFEFWDWRNKNLPELRAISADLGMTVTAFSGHRETAMANPLDKASLCEEVRRSLEVAMQLGARNLMLLTDRLLPDGSAAPLPEHLSAAQKMESVAEALMAASELARGSGVVMVLEPLNTRLDHPGYFLDRSGPGFELVRQLNSTHAKLLYDVYHMALMGEDVCAVVSANIGSIGHVHIADMPGRHEPGTGVIDYQALRETLREKGYQGSVGMEFSPASDSKTAAESAWRLFQ
ncbi:MAG: TIM barrel protein [Acidobacteriia bacterium]|nr:TIM barrel protein [Terriglobia bacterium]